MAELNRLTQAAFRTTSLLRASTATRCQPIYSLAVPPTSCKRHLSSTARHHLSTSQKTSAGSQWENPTREPRKRPAEDTIIKKPDISVYSNPSRPAAEPAGDAKKPYSMSEMVDMDISDFGGQVAPEERDGVVIPKPTLRLVPRTGRTVHIGRNIDVARAFKIQQMQVAVNKVRQDVQKQKFHERPGLKKKRLRSERWKVRFKTGFKAAVARVRELSRQGW
ncbi:hypothetical protein GGR56DRAFT_46242 [Xylariaceae sp. FL0804]|nr:hypothetical protein GGR56DRAFT_46242 [Xylariaceae sp. FL0804]